MVINFTWANVIMATAVAVSLLLGLIGGVGAVIQWRFDALQNQLSERMILYQREVNRIERRLETLEHKDIH